MTHAATAEFHSNNMGWICSRCSASVSPQSVTCPCCSRSHSLPVSMRYEPATSSLALQPSATAAVIAKPCQCGDSGCPCSGPAGAKQLLNE